MFLSAASSALLRKSPYWAFNAVSNPESMASVWVSDVPDNVGRTVTGYQRGGKIEALRWGILTWTTGIVWGFGVPCISRAWNRAIPALTRYIDAAPDKRGWLKSIVPSYGVKYANLQESLFETHSAKADTYHVITAKNAQTFAAAEAQQIEKLAHALPNNLASKALQQAKAGSNELLTHIQSAFDASGKVLEEGLVKKQAHYGGWRTAYSAVIPAVLVGVVLPLVIQVLQRGWIRDEKEKKVTSLLSHWKRQQTFTSNNTQQQGNSLNNKAMFSGGGIMAPLLNTLRNSDIANTLLVDGVISGGRVATALNWLDALENFLEETGVIAFLFYFRKKIQFGFENWASKRWNLLASLETPQIKWLIEKLHTPKAGEALHKISDAHVNLNGAHSFVEQLKHFKQTIVSRINLDDFAPKWYEKITGLSGDNLNTLKKGSKTSLAEWEKVLFEDNGLRKYLQEGRTDNWFFEMAKEEGYIAMRNPFDVSKKALQGLAPDAIKALKASQVWDYTQAIKTDKMHSLAKTLSEFADRANITGKGAVSHWSEAELKNIAKLARHSIGGKGVAFFISLLISSAFIGWIIPKGRQYVTYLISGSHQYPGALKDGQR